MRGEPRRVGADFNLPKKFSEISASNSPPNPPTLEDSCTTKMRLVFSMDANTVSRSQGQSVRRSITSASTPFSVSNAAALKQSFADLDQLSKVMSLPVLRTAALPSSTGPALSSTSPVVSQSSFVLHEHDGIVTTNRRF